VLFYPDFLGRKFLNRGCLKRVLLYFHFSTIVVCPNVLVCTVMEGIKQRDDCINTFNMHSRVVWTRKA
jgi:hypothetical protein